MAKITLNIDADYSAAKSKLEELKSVAQSISGTKIDLGLGTATTQLQNYTKEQARVVAELEKSKRKQMDIASKTEQAEARAALQTQKHTDRMEELAASAGKTTTAFDAFSVALGNIAARGFHMVVSKITQGIREAVTTMKDVDTQLTNISKVSGITGKALSDMGERAYETASKYGVAADEYLSSVYTFQKAGLGESAEAMGELAVKTMLVGDTTADVASQFLISANAAWKMGGDIERLNQIVDEADYINNNYATDLTKLSQGLPRVASVAAQAGMSAEETLAAIGTITAVTQESGTKAATALRALILNIEGQVGEFVDETGESFTVTEESVKSMQGLMEKYASAELEAARASGELINPMTAIKAIFEGMANSDLNDQELFTLLSGMGGKLRTNQLTALVQNYELFDDMLGKIANSAGTADSEISLMMESWERKTQVLKNTWTEFIADFVNTDTVKGAIGLLTNFIGDLDDRIDRAKNPFFDRDQTSKEISDLQAEYDSLSSKGSSLTNVEKTRLEYLERQLEVLRLQKQMEEEQAAQRLQNQLTNNRQDERSLTLYKKDSADISYTGDIKAYQNSLKELNSEWSQYYQNLISVREAGIALSDSQQEFINLYEENLTASKAVTESENLVNGYHELRDELGNVVAYEKDYGVTLDELTQKMADLRDAQEEYEAADTAEARASAWENVLQKQHELAEATQGYSDAEIAAAQQAAGVVSAVSGIGPEVDSATTAVQALTAALQGAAGAAAGIHVGAIFKGKRAAEGTSNASGGLTLVNEIGPELISENGKAYIANGGRPAVVNLSKGAIVLPANVTKEALKGGGVSHTINAAVRGAGDAGVDLTTTTTPRYTEPTGPAAEAQRQRQQAIEEATSWKCPKCGTVNPAGYKKCYKCGTKKPGTSGGGGGKKPGGGGKSKKEKAAEAAKDLEAKLKSLDKQAALAHKEKRYSDEEALYKEAVALIKKQLSKYKSAGYKDKSDEVVDLKSKLHDYEDKIESLNKNKWDEEIEAREQALREQRARDEMADKQAAVEKARQALENAKKQRNVRVFNAATGQWEWVADQGAVQRAQEQFDSAQQAWTRAQEDAAIDELKRRRDAGEKYPGGSGSGTEILDTISTYGGVGQAVTVGGRGGSKIIDAIGEFGALYGGAPTDTSISTAVKNGVGGDSHDTIYNFGNITLSEAEAKSTSVAELAKRLNVLKIS